MKNKILVFILLAVTMAPQIVFAAWWNPFSWKLFSKIISPPVIEVDGIATSTNFTASTTKEKTITGKTIIDKKDSDKPRRNVSAINALDGLTQRYENLARLTQSRIAYVTKYQDELVPTLDKTSSNFLLVSSISANFEYQKLLKELDTKMAELRSTTNQADNEDVERFTNFIVNSENKVTLIRQEYISDLDQIIAYMKARNQVIKNSIRSNNAQQNITTFSTKSSQCDNIDQQVRDQISSGGGIATESQIQGIVAQKSRDLGCGSYYSGGYSSVQCNSLDGGYDCSGSGGTRIQAIPNGNGGFEIRSW